MTDAALCFSEESALAVPLVEFARSLGEGSVAAVAVDSGEESTSRLVGAGADTIYRTKGTELSTLPPQQVAQVLSAALERSGAPLVLIGSTKRGRETAARLAGERDGAVLSGGSHLVRATDGRVVTRELLSGNAVGEELISAALAIVSLTPPAPTTSSARPSGTPTLVDLDVPSPKTGAMVLERRPKPTSGFRLEEAERVVAIGRGLRKREDLPLVEALANVLHAAVGCTRPIAAEAGWMSDEHWIGLTGHRVRPKLYVAVGLSGAAQHLVGMRDSRLVVAINKDANAPIFAHADFRIVGDLYEILPALTGALQNPAPAA
jgi:electron transfer flavoprotein alpha subunit